MITAGIDAGASRTKAVILQNHELFAFAVIEAGRESVVEVSRRAFHEACCQANIAPGEIACVAATGMGRRHVTFAHRQVPDSISLATGIHWLSPCTKTVLDVGTQKSLAIRCHDGVVVRSRANDKCASGTGRYLEMVAEILGIGIHELGELSLRAAGHVEVQNTCTVFAESEIISLVHMKSKLDEIAKGALRGLAQRLYSLLLEVGWEKELSLVGGVARNHGLVRELEELLGCQVLVPDDPDTAAAAGAALATQMKEGLQVDSGRG